MSELYTAERAPQKASIVEANLETVEPCVSAGTESSGPQDGPTPIQAFTKLSPVDVEPKRSPQHGGAESRLRREVTHQQTGTPKLGFALDVVTARLMADVALRARSTGGGAPANPAAASHDRRTFAAGASPNRDRQPAFQAPRDATASQTKGVGSSSSAAAAAAAAAYGDQVPSAASAAATSALTNAAVKDEPTPEKLAAAASAAALAAAMSSAKLAAIAAARSPPPPGESKRLPSPRHIPHPSPRRNGGIRRSPVAETSTSTSTPTTGRKTRSPPPSGAAAAGAPAEAAGQQSGGRRGGSNVSRLSAFANTAIALAAAGLPGESGDRGSSSSSVVAAAASDGGSSLLVTHSKLLVDRELLVVEVRRLASQVQHLTEQQGLLQGELQRLLHQNSDLNSALATTVTTCESQAELMDILNEAVRSTVLVDEHEVGATAPPAGSSTEKPVSVGATATPE